MEFVFPKQAAAALEVIQVPLDVAIVAFHQATDAGMIFAKESYTASFDIDAISVLVLAKWIKAYYDYKATERK
jgi:hypothetical protein